MLAVDRVGCADDRDRAEVGDRAAGFLDRQADIVHRDLRGEFEALRVGLAIIGGPVVIGARQCRGVIGGEIVVAQDLPPARPVHDGDVNPLDIHRRQGRRRVEAARPGYLEMRVAGAAAAAQFAAGNRGSALHVVRRDREALHLHPHDRVGIRLVFLALGEGLLLPAEKARRVGLMRAVEIARPQIAGLHHVQVAVEDQIAVACHRSPPVWVARKSIADGGGGRGAFANCGSAGS